MLARWALINSISRPYIISMAYSSRMLVMVPFLALIGCTGEGQGGPVISSLSAPAGATASLSLDLATDHMEGHQARQLPLTSHSTDVTTDFASDFSPGPLSTDGSSPSSDSSDDIPMITVTSTSTGVTVRLNWQHPADAGIFGYYVYYGKQPAQESGSCAAYEAKQAVDAPPATIAGLEHDTLYYFAVRHFNDSEDACSEEIMVATPPAHT